MAMRFWKTGGATSGRSAEAVVPRVAHLKHASLFARDQRGVVALMFGLMVLPLFAAIGLAIDFGNVMAVRTKAQMAADAAVLQASGIARDILKAGDGSDAATAKALADARTRAIALFNASAAQSKIENYTFDIQMTKTGLTLSSTASFSIKSDNVIGKVFGSDSFSATGSAVSTSSLPSYVDVHVLMDVSQSMGLAATNDEAIRLFGLTNPSCVFGCHVKAKDQKAELPNEQIAHNNGIRLRVDVMRDAVTKMITDAQNKSYGDSIYRFGLYTMSLDAGLTNQVLNVIASLNGNYTSLKSSAQAIDLSANNDLEGRGDSHIHNQLTDLKTKMANSGDGSSQDKAKVYVFMVTDGLRDYRTNGAVNQHVTGPIDPAFCAPFKTTTAGVTMGVIYTTYLPIYENPNKPSGPLEKNYKNLVEKHVANIPVKLRECASTGWFYEASDEPAISAAFDRMFAQTSNAPTLTH